jgi:hypothetical protein
VDKNERLRDAIERDMVGNPNKDHIPSIRIATIYEKGEFKRLQDDQVVSVPEGSVVDLIIYGERFKEDSPLSVIGQRTRIPFIPAETKLYFAVERRTVTANLEACKQWDFYFKKVATIDPENPTLNKLIKDMRAVLWVEMQLKSDADLLLKADRPGRLIHSPVFLPYFGVECQSINSAVTYIIKHLMPQRPTNTANVFKKVICVIGEEIQVLEDRRESLVDAWAKSQKEEAAKKPNGLFD